MATENYRIVKCPYCQSDFEAKFWSVVRGDVDIDLKELILNGEFNLLMCPYCNKIFSYEDNFVYLDPSAEILAFVMPDYYENRNDLIAKLEEDYNSIKGYLLEDNKLNFKPYYLFGIEQLIDLLKKDIDIQEETEVIEFICKSNNIKTRKINKVRARNKNLPFVVPYIESFKTGDVMNVIEDLYRQNNHLKRLENLIKELENTQEDTIEFLDLDED